MLGTGLQVEGAMTDLSPPQFISVPTRRQTDTEAQEESVVCQKVWPMKLKPFLLHKVPPAFYLWGFGPLLFHRQLLFHTGLETYQETGWWLRS